MLMDRATGRSDCIYDHCAMREQNSRILEDEVIRPTIDRFPLVLDDACIYAVADTREACVTFWQQTFGPPAPLVKGRQVIRQKVRILTFLEIQRIEPKLYPERLEEVVGRRFAGSRGKENNSSHLSSRL